jgi:hypothetical protein
MSDRIGCRTGTQDEQLSVSAPGVLRRGASSGCLQPGSGSCACTPQDGGVSGVYSCRACAIDSHVESVNPGQQVSRDRIRYDAKAALVGRRVLEARYRDVHNVGAGAREWDYSDWRHAIMGAELRTGRGPSCIRGSSTFGFTALKCSARRCQGTATASVKNRDPGPGMSAALTAGATG